MNNSQFRRLVLDTPRRQDGDSSTSSLAPKPAVLGSRTKSSMPMTPRTVKGGPTVSFARQLAEHNASAQPQKRFRSSAAPKGTRLAEGYRDRTRERTEGEEDDVAARIKALEEAVKLGQLDSETFEKLRDNITAGDISKTHLIKGLDRKLLERVRRGEDVLSNDSQPVVQDGENSTAPDIDEELDQLEQKDVAPNVREDTLKKGHMPPPPPPVAGVKRSRDAILAELKAARQAAAEAKKAAQPQLGAKFRRLGDNREKSRIERNAKGRDVLVTVDEDGKVKRKVRKISEAKEQNELLMPDKDAIPLGMDIPEIIRPPAAIEEEDGDIFENVGNDYDPLADLQDEVDEASSSEDENGHRPDEVPPQPSADSAQVQSRTPAGETPAPRSEHPISSPSATDEEKDNSSSMAPPPLPKPKRNYFNDKSSPSSTATSAPSLNDPTILAALRKTRDLAPLGDPTSADESPPDTIDDEDTEEKEARLRRLASKLATSDRDMQDLDLGFGSSRFADAEDLDEGSSKMKLSQWRGAGGAHDDEEEEGAEPGGAKKRKRGPKKRKGDKNSAPDVLKVLEGRRSGAK